jgi:predicted small secreted protein
MLRRGGSAGLPLYQEICSMRKLFTLCSLFVFVFTLAACNTMEGAGEDIGEAGDAMEDAAE